jgi:serine/threonine protein phosphatase PrpC
MRLAQEANVHIYQTGRSHSPGGTSMATTLVACAFRYDRLVVAHAGDSRCYLIRQGGKPVAHARSHRCTGTGPHRNC